MLRYVIWRVGSCFITIWVILTLLFFLIRLLPGDPAKLMSGLYATEEMIEQQRRLMGLDKSLGCQYILYMKQLLLGNWGKSLISHRPVVELVFESFPKTLSLTVFGVCVALFLSFPLGIWAGIHPSSVGSRILVPLSLLGQALPEYWVGIVLILVFARWLGLAPSFGYGGIIHHILPGLAVGLPMVGVLTRLTRSEIAKQLKLEYVTAARAKGLSERRVLFPHIVRNSLVPIVTMLGMQIGSLMAGSITVEVVFAWPGMGRLLISSLGQRDYPVMQIVVGLSAAFYVFLNLVVDLIYGVLDPRVRYE